MNNDERILQLKRQIEEKKEQLGKAEKFVPTTNLSLEVDGIRYNLNVLTKEQIVPLMIKVNSYRLSAEDLGVTCFISGYPVEDWLRDMKDKYKLSQRKEEEKSLKLMESKLHQLLSEGKKVELEIDEIESLLKK